MENIVLFQCFKKDLSRLILKIYNNLQHISLITKSNLYISYEFIFRKQFWENDHRTRYEDRK